MVWGKKAMNVISQYKSRWHPAELNGHPTFSYRKQPITFIVEEEKKKCKELPPAGSVL